MRFFTRITIFPLIIALFCLFPLRGALATAGQTPFGGFSLFVIICTASGGNLLIINTAVAGPPKVIFNKLTSRLYPYSNIELPGNWLLGNVQGEQECAIQVGPYRVSLGMHPVITIVGTSDATHLAQSGNSSSQNNNGTQGSEYQETSANTTQPPVKPSGPGSETPADGGQTEAQTRAGLEANGVHIAPGLSPTLSPVGKLPNNAIAGAEDLSQDCGPGCNVEITSGARQPGNPTPPGEHGTGKPVFDLNKDPGVDAYVTSNSASHYTNSSGTHYVMPNGDEYLDENYGNTGGSGPHWHVRINADHMSA